MVETCGQLRSGLFMFRPFRKHNGHVLTCNLMTFGDLIIGLPIGPILCVFRKSTWQQAACVLLLSFRRFVIIPSSRNTCHASSSLFVICCFTSSCQTAETEPSVSGWRKRFGTVRDYPKSWPILISALIFPLHAIAISKLSTNSIIVNSMSDQFSIASFNWPIFELR